MPDLKLSRLPDRTPIKLSITVMPDLHQALKDYAEFWGLKRGIAGRSRPNATPSSAKRRSSPPSGADRVARNTRCSTRCA